MFLKRIFSSLLLLAVQTLSNAQSINHSDVAHPYLNGDVSNPLVTLVFASQNTHTPESAFGHIFLLIHEDEVPAPDSLVIEFIGTVENIGDMAKTVFSSVPGQYKFETYERKKTEYDLEDRDLFFLRLKLTERELKSLLSRTAQESSQTYPYTFTQKNCAYYLGRLLSLEGISNQTALNKSVIRPIDIVNSIPAERINKTTIQPSSRRVFEHYRSLLDDSDAQIFKNFTNRNLPDIDSQTMSNELRNATSSFIRLQLPRETEVWQRQNLARAQKEVWHDSPNLKLPSIDSETNGHWTIGTATGGGIVLGYQPELRNFFTQKTDDFRNSYLDRFAAEIGIKDNKAQLHELSVFRTESIQPEAAKSRMLDISYKDWSHKTGKNQSELSTSIGIGWAAEVAGLRFGVIPNLTLGAERNAPQAFNTRLGYRAVTEYQYQAIALRTSIDQWSNSPFNFHQERKFQARWILTKELNLGWELSTIPEISKRNHKALLIYSL